MYCALFFLLGLLTSRWIDQRVVRLAAKAPWPSVRESARREAKSVGLDVPEKGKVLRLADADAADAIARSTTLFHEEQ